MKVTVYIPTPFRGMTGNQASVPVEGSTIAEVLDNLDDKFPGVHDLIYSRDHETHRDFEEVFHGFPIGALSYHPR